MPYDDYHNDDKVEETVINIMPEIYENASSSTISVTIDPAMDYEQLSQFYYDDSKFFQPLNQTPNEVNADATKLGGDVGTAIAASGLVNARVYYELNPETGKVEFVGKDKMLQLLKNEPELLNAFLQESSESAEVTGKYLLRLK